MRNEVIAYVAHKLSVGPMGVRVLSWASQGVTSALGWVWAGSGLGSGSGRGYVEIPDSAGVYDARIRESDTLPTRPTPAPEELWMTNYAALRQCRPVNSDSYPQIREASSAKPEDSAG